MTRNCNSQTSLCEDICGMRREGWQVCPMVIAGQCSPAYLNPLTAKLFNLNFHPLEVVSR